MPRSQYGTVPNIAPGYLTELARQRGAAFRQDKAIEAQERAKPGFWERVGEAALGQVIKSTVGLGAERIAQEFPAAQARIAQAKATTKLTGVKTETAGEALKTLRTKNKLNEYTMDAIIGFSDAEQKQASANQAKMQAARNLQSAQVIGQELAQAMQQPSEFVGPPELAPEIPRTELGERPPPSMAMGVQPAAGLEPPRAAPVVAPGLPLPDVARQPAPPLPREAPRGLQPEMFKGALLDMPPPPSMAEERGYAPAAPAELGLEGRPPATKEEAAVRQVEEAERFLRTRSPEALLGDAYGEPADTPQAKVEAAIKGVVAPDLIDPGLKKTKPKEYRLRRMAQIQAKQFVRQQEIAEEKLVIAKRKAMFDEIKAITGAIKDTTPKERRGRLRKFMHRFQITDKALKSGNAFDFFTAAGKTSKEWANLRAPGWRGKKPPAGDKPPEPSKAALKAAAASIKKMMTENSVVVGNVAAQMTKETGQTWTTAHVAQAIMNGTPEASEKIWASLKAEGLDVGRYRAEYSGKLAVVAEKFKNKTTQKLADRAHAVVILTKTQGFKNLSVEEQQDFAVEMMNLKHALSLRLQSKKHLQGVSKDLIKARIKSIMDTRERMYAGTAFSKKLVNFEPLGPNAMSSAEAMLQNLMASQKDTKEEGIDPTDVKKQPELKMTLPPKQTTEAPTGKRVSTKGWTTANKHAFLNEQSKKGTKVRIGGKESTVEKVLEDAMNASGGDVTKAVEKAFKKIEHLVRK